ncbi:GerAB/ArcD/ProY family transporter [Paenibacillus aestuarii]|uniref:Endospore germination permease n=1 Tax=Paenibacillus aestuarii TaxID=516965 RepID=A0ABW0K1D3_9BACL|nr:endospore germination permease [Paenibacillus aestuarii]
MQVTKKISALQLYFIFLLSIGITNHVLLIPVLLQASKRDSWIGTVAALVPILLLACLLYAVIRKTAPHSIIHWLNQRYGRLVTMPVVVIVAGISLLNAIITLKDVIIWTNVSYLPRTPQAIINLLFVIFCFFSVRAGLRAIAISSGILLPAVVLLGYFVMGANFQFKDYSLLTPLFTHGYGPTLHALLLTCGASSELVYLLFFQHHLSTPMRLSSLLIIAVCLVGLSLGPLMGAIAIFGPFEAANLRYPAFEQWRMVSLGKYISHLDFLSIYQWISGAFIRISILLYLFLDMIGAAKPRSRTVVLAMVCVLLIGLGFYPIEDAWLLEQIQTWYYPLLLAISVFLLVVLLGLSYLPKKPKEGT